MELRPRPRGELSRPSEWHNFVQSAVDNHRLPIVLGDLNVDPETDESLASLLQNAHLQDPFPLDTWTHYYIPQKKDEPAGLHPASQKSQCAVNRYCAQGIDHQS
jgi:hypothetical protein